MTTTSRITNLDELIPLDKKITLAGQVYVLPGDVSVEVVMRHQAAVDLDALDVDTAQQMYEDILKLCRYKQPKLESIPLLRGQLLFAVRHIYIANPGEREIDLDLLVPKDPKRVRLAGRTYVLPSDIPVQLWLRLDRLTPEQHTDSEILRGIYDSLLDLFRMADPDLTELNIHVGSLVRAVGLIYGQPEEPAVAVPPTRATGKPNRGARRSPKPSAKRSGSRT